MNKGLWDICKSIQLPYTSIVARKEQRSHRGSREGRHHTTTGFCTVLYGSTLWQNVQQSGQQTSWPQRDFWCGDCDLKALINICWAKSRSCLGQEGFAMENNLGLLESTQLVLAGPVCKLVCISILSQQLKSSGSSVHWSGWWVGSRLLSNAFGIGVVAHNRGKETSSWGW